MKLYFLVEGRRTEVKVYPRWLSHLLPGFARVEAFDEPGDPCYYLISSYGYPSLLHDHLANALTEARRAAYDALILCLDADELTVAEREAEVAAFMATAGLRADGLRLQVIVQNRCFETWFLGNRKALTRAPEGRLRSFVDFYDVSQRDPEAMGCHPDFGRHADFHYEYVREMLDARGVKFTKEFPRHVGDPAYLGQLIGRCQERPGDLGSLQTFLRFCATVTGEDRHSKDRDYP